MGSGCNNSPNKKFRCAEVISDQCIIYTGEPVEWLGVCTGDRISEVLAAVIDNLEDLASGQGITLSGITANCAFVQSFLVNSDKSLFSLIQGLFDNQCTLRQLIQDLEDSREPAFSFDTKCLASLLPASPTRNQIIQANITKTCELETKVNSLTEQLSIINEGDGEGEINIVQVIKDEIGNFLKTNVTSCQKNIQVVGSGANVTLNFIGLPPVGSLQFGIFNIADFDNTGKGRAERGMCGWYISNGLNGTVDMRGFTPAGATNIPGGTLNPLVQSGGDNDLSTNIGQRKGKNKYTLSASQLPNHEHQVNDPGHSHPYVNWPNKANLGQNGNTATRNDVGDDQITGTSTTGISVTGLKGPSGQPIDNRQPTFYAMWIQRVGNVKTISESDTIITNPTDTTVIVGPPVIGV